MNTHDCGILTGVVVLGHGSRASEAAVLLDWIAARLDERCDFAVAPASLQFNSPTLADSCRRLAAQGARRIVVAPYFLFSGNHMKLDIPGELEALQTELGGVEILLAASLGADERLVEVMHSRIAEALGAGAAPRAGGSQAPAAQTAGADAATAAIAATATASGAPLDRDTISQHPIEAQSFDIIDELLKPADPQDPEYQIARRVVHATGDPQLAQLLRFSPGAVEEAVGALSRGAEIICDVNMVAAGIAPTAAALGLPVYSLVSETETSRLAQAEGITRGAAGIRRAVAHLQGAVVAIGNAPTALFECLRLVEETCRRPALIVGVPVGFVGAAESKQALMESGLPCISIPGYRGGSNVAVAIVNALMRLPQKHEE